MKPCQPKYLKAKIMTILFLITMSIAISYLAWDFYRDAKEKQELEWIQKLEIKHCINQYLND
jgi:hypothetical protein